jgi:hypothetical protein
VSAEAQGASVPAARWPAWKTRRTATPDLHFEGGRRLQPGNTRPPRAEGEALVSFVTVVRNGVATLARTLDSVAAQTWPHVEHIVLDGASTDGTVDIVRQHVDAIDYATSAPDGGLYDALNQAIELVTGDLICVLNADDWLTPDAAALAARAWAEAGAGKSEARLFCTSAWVIEGDRKSLWLPARIDLSAVLICANLCHNGVYATRAAYEASGPYRTDLRIAADFAWLVQCQRVGVAFTYLDAPTVHYRLGGLSSDKRRHTLECMQVLRLHVPALSEAEAWGLVHAFHTFPDNLAAFTATRPAHLGRFLLALAQRHSAETFLMQALAPAALARMLHPADGTPAGRLSRWAKLRRSLHKRAVAWQAWRSRADSPPG